MEQKDYIMRDIEKIGLIMCAIGEKIFGGKGSLAFSLETQMRDAKDIILKQNILPDYCLFKAFYI